MLLLVIAGVAAIAAGGAAIWFGIPVKEFSFGNTMILAGAMAICNGLLLVGLGLVIRELKAIKLGLRERTFETVDRETDEHLLPAGSIVGRSGRSGRDEFRVHHAPSDSLAPAGSRRPAASRPEDGAVSGQDVEPADIVGGKLSQDVVSPVAPPTKAKRNLLFSSSRKDRENEGRAATSSAKSVIGALSAEQAVASDTGGTSQPHPSFNDAWPRVERSSRADLPAPRRDASLTPPLQVDRISSSRQDTSSATVVKSGTVDGMAYSLYSDGSIEAQMPEGMMRFASIEQLRTHIDRTR